MKKGGPVELYMHAKEWILKVPPNAIMVPHQPHAVHSDEEWRLDWKTL